MAQRHQDCLVDVPVGFLRSRDEVQFIESEDEYFLELQAEFSFYAANSFADRSPATFNMEDSRIRALFDHEEFVLPPKRLSKRWAANVLVQSVCKRIRCDADLSVSLPP